MTPIIALETYFPLFASLLAELDGRPGDIAEFGVYAGVTTRELSRLAPDRTIWAFDTFEGLPASQHTPDIDTRNHPGQFRAPSETYADLLKSPNIRPLKGLFSHTIPLWHDRPNPLPLVLAYIDCDWLESAHQAFSACSTMKPGSFVVVDDYFTHAGIHRATQEFLSTKPQATFDGLTIRL